MNKVEEWRDILGFPGYQVSSLGKVRSFRIRGHSSGLTKEPRLLTLSPTSRGYLKVVLVLPDKTKKTKTIHVLMAESFFGPRPKGLVVRHLDDDQLNNSIDNLAYGTSSDNSIDVVTNGNHKLAKLSYQDVNKIKEMYLSGGYSYRSLGKIFGVDGSQISRVMNNQTWRRSQEVKYVND